MPLRTRPGRIRLRIRARFVLVLGLLVLGTGAVGAVALTGLSTQRAANLRLRAALAQSESNGRLRADLVAFSGQLQFYLRSDDERLLRDLRGEIEQNVDAIGDGLSVMRRSYADRPADLQIARANTRAFARLVAIWNAERISPGARSGAAVERLTTRVHQQLDASIDRGRTLQRDDEQVATAAAVATDRRYHLTRTQIVETLIGLLLVSILLAAWLVRSIVPRARRYAEFAGRLSTGDLGARLDVHGADELDDLARSLDGMATSRQAAASYAATQTEFTEALQVADSEEDAHLVLSAHLRRSIPSSSVVVMNRNNSADRLEARTPVRPGSALAAGLDGAAPRDCLAVRLARPQRRDGDDADALLRCGVCGGTPGAIACNPLLVSGEVIGAVLVTTPDPIAETDDRRLQDTVVQAAPVLANLRNLAIAELRAATDSLTGLPNARAVHDTVKRMAAQAGRTKAPLAAALLDLDHFKQVNDTFGHGRGDDVLAAVGAVLRGSLRESDFIGRMGGEEFVMLLPATDGEGALAAAEKIRAAVAKLTVPGVDRKITVSIGIAVIPEHAGDADAVLRAADRALYAAKEHGRNRIEVAVPSEAAAAYRAGIAPVAPLRAS
jgi:diguanylate cyclase (GGDEF)-like protein